MRQESMTCSVLGCQRPRGLAKGLCGMHYQRQRRHGSTGQAASRVEARGGYVAVSVSTSGTVAKAMAKSAKSEGISISEAWTRAAKVSLIVRET